jgi:hypothetical protein
MTLYAVTIFLSAFLLFQVQPLIAKIILPWFGGSAAVWSASLLFFQLILLAGYAYAHLSIRFLKARAQMIVHVGLLLVSCALLPILPSPVWRPTEAGDPTFRILQLLTATIGLPYFLLSSTSPLLQAWYVRRTGSGVPYRLFALSNFGSMLALISFPFFVEPTLTSRQQAYSWSTGYVLFGLLCAFVAWVSKDSMVMDDEKPVVETAEDIARNEREDRLAQRPSFGQLILWIILSTCASVLLVAVTNHMSQNVAPIPLLWVAPLAVYLLTFILAFESDRIYQRWLFIPLVVVSVAAMAYMIYANEGNLNIRWAIPGFTLALFCCCMLCHGELARRRPAPQYLTLFYLMVSVGGALGGTFVAVIAPRVFDRYFELPIFLGVTGILALVATWKIASHNLKPVAIAALLLICLGGFGYWGYKVRADKPVLEFVIVAGIVSVVLVAGWNLWHSKLGLWPARAVLLSCLVFLGWYLRKHETDALEHVILTERNFYGVLEVRDDPPTKNFAVRTLLHGTIDHGAQLLDPAMRYTTTSYYMPGSGVGRALNTLKSRGPVRYGVIGLGSGVLSNYSRKGDYLRIYEINDAVENIAQTRFTFFPHSEADKKILLGDARLVLEKEPPQNFDLLAVDAFSSDAIPVHLLTREAIQVYYKHLKPDGVLALHISNRYLELEPVAERGAETVGRKGMVIEDDGTTADYASASTWVLITSQPDFFKGAFFKDADMHEPKMPANFRTWTDDYSNLFQILQLK